MIADRIDMTKPWTGTVPIESVVPNPEQPRKHFDQAALERTATSCQRRQISAITVVPHEMKGFDEVRWMIVDGERRWRGLKGIGERTIKVAYDPQLKKEEMFEASLAANFCREGHRHEEVALAVGKLAEAGKSDEDIAALVGKSTLWVVNYRKLKTLHPILLRRMDVAPDGERKVPMNIAQLLVTVDPKEQLKEWEKVQKLPGAEAFHKMRTSGKVRHAGKRSPADDGVYAVGKAMKALSQVTALMDLPLPMMKGLSLEYLKELVSLMDTTHHRCEKTIERLKRAIEQAEGREAA